MNTKIALLVVGFSGLLSNVAFADEAQTEAMENNNARVVVCSTDMQNLEECLSNFESEEAEALLALPTLSSGFSALVRCESWNYQAELCAIKEPLTSVTLVQQHSKTNCGGKWYNYGTGILVNGGCRATFLVTSSSNKTVNTQSCSSWNYQYAECPIGYANSVWLSRKESSSECQYGVSWGYTADKIWVSKGCRARFNYIQ